MTDVPPWEVYVLEYARAKDQPVASLINGTHDEGVRDTPFSFVMARSGDRIVLVDTGFMREGIGAEMSERFNVPDWISPLRLLAELGVAPEDVTDIVLSHAHFDHMGSIHKFPRARLYIQKSELLSWHEAMALPRQFGYLTAIINPDDLRSMFDASVEHRVTLLDGDRHNLLPGLHARLGPGHTVGQQFVVIETTRGDIVVSGDCVYGARNLKGHAGDGVYVPLNNAVGSVWDQLRTIDRINEAIEGDLGRLIILHDVERWKDLPVVTEIEGFRIARAA
jgi:glyoxylase-like metal-dependent hydrolase (beta-lactamase superfamily II)